MIEEVDPHNWRTWFLIMFVLNVIGFCYLMYRVNDLGREIYENMDRFADWVRANLKILSGENDDRVERRE